MASCAEDLPAELWFMIYSFLEYSDIQRAFSNLNESFTKLFRSSNLHACLNVKIGGCAILDSSRLPIYPQAFGALHANLFGSTDLLTFMDRIRIFPNIDSLSIHIRRDQNYNLLMSLLPDLPSLQHLGISCPMLNTGEPLEPLCTEIFKLPNLRSCELRLTRNAVISESTSHINTNLPISRSLTYFHLDASISRRRLKNLIQSMPSLRILTAYFYRHQYDAEIDCSTTHITSNACTSFIFQHIFLEDLAELAPDLMSIYIYIEPYTHCNRVPFIEEFIPLKFKRPKTNIRMIWKKNIISGMFNIISPIIFQGRENDKGYWIVGQHARNYTVLKTIPVIA